MSSDQTEIGELENEAPGKTSSVIEGAEICPCCLNEVPTVGSLCPHCAAPISGSAGLVLWETIKAQHYVHRQALANSRKPIVFIDAWLIFFPSLIGGAAMLGEMVRRGVFIPFPDLFFLLEGAVSTAILYHVTCNFFCKAEIRNPRKLKCLRLSDYFNSGFTMPVSTL